MRLRTLAPLVVLALLGLAPAASALTLERDVKSVHTDVTALVEAGVIERAESGAVSFPYDAVRVDFTVQAA